MTGQNPNARPPVKAVGVFVTDAFKEAVQMVDLLLEGLVVVLSWIGKGFAKVSRCRKCKERPLQVIRAMSMVSDHVLRDVGLDRPKMGAIGELSTEAIHGCRTEREVS